MANRRDKQVAVYLEKQLFAVLQEGILVYNPEMSASDYFRQLLLSDLELKGLLTPDIKEFLMGTLPIATAVDAH